MRGKKNVLTVDFILLFLTECEKELPFHERP